MRRGEYQSTLLDTDGNLRWSGKWWLRQINEQEIPHWKKAEPFPSIATYCNYMDEQGWELISISYPHSYPGASLLFKRPYTDGKISKT